MKKILELQNNIKALENYYNYMETLDNKCLEEIEKGNLELSDKLEKQSDDFYTNVYYPLYEKIIKEIMNICDCDVKTASNILHNNKIKEIMLHYKII